MRRDPACVKRRAALIFTDANGIRRVGQVWRAMPSLIRLLVIVGVLVGLVYGGMVALVVLVDPKPREMSVRIPNERLAPNR